MTHIATKIETIEQYTKLDFYYLGKFDGYCGFKNRYPQNIDYCNGYDAGFIEWFVG